jgi:hypothetical protein
LRNPQRASQLLYVPLHNLDLGHAAALRALPAVDRVVNLFGRLPELPFDKSVRLDPLPEAQVFGALLLALPSDLNQVSKHSLSGYNQHRMPDRLFLSCWVRGFSASNMLRHFETVLSRFPFSKLAAHGPMVRVRAIEMAEPPLVEKEFPPTASPGELMPTAREFAQEDCCIEVEAAWDLWQYDGDWKLAPAQVVLLCFAPDFENEAGDHLRFEFGLDSRFLPIEGLEGSARMGQSNLRSLLHLVGDIERSLPIERRQLWSESGVNFAELLAAAVARMEVN